MKSLISRRSQTLHSVLVEAPLEAISRGVWPHTLKCRCWSSPWQTPLMLLQRCVTPRGEDRSGSVVTLPTVWKLQTTSADSAGREPAAAVLTRSHHSHWVSVKVICVGNDTHRWVSISCGWRKSLNPLTEREVFTCCWRPHGLIHSSSVWLVSPAPRKTTRLTNLWFDWFQYFRWHHHLLITQVKLLYWNKCETGTESV